MSLLSKFAFSHQVDKMPSLVRRVVDRAVWFALGAAMVNYWEIGSLRMIAGNITLFFIAGSIVALLFGTAMHLVRRRV